MRVLRPMRVLLLVLLLATAGCSSPGERESPPPTSPLSPVALDTSAWPQPVGDIDLLRSQYFVQARALDVSIVVFDPGLPEGASSMGAGGVFPEIREAESRYLPVLLRAALVDSGGWGVVRILPNADPGAELLLTTQILHSDGQYLALAVKAEDASGRLWFDRVYTDRAGAADYPVAEGEDPFGDLYRQLANDLLTLQSASSDSELAKVRQIARLRYADWLAPEAFAGYLQRGEQGTYELLRLPALDDPMMARVMRLREEQFRFIDQVDEQYRELLDELRPTYDLWRQYGQEQASYIAQYSERLADRDSAGRRGSFAAMQQSYNAFRWHKIQEQDLRELAGGFNNEVAPTVLDTRGRVFRLSGSLNRQYQDWQAILRDIFRLETGFAGDPDS